MAAPSPKQRAVTMKRNGMDDSLVGAILGLEAADVRALLLDADPAVELGGPAYTVIEVTDLAIEAAEDPSETLLGVVNIDLSALCLWNLVLELAEAPAMEAHLSVAADDSTANVNGIAYLGPDAADPTALWSRAGNFRPNSHVFFPAQNVNDVQLSILNSGPSALLATPDPGPVEHQVVLSLSAPHDEITVVRARAAFLVI